MGYKIVDHSSMVTIIYCMLQKLVNETFQAMWFTPHRETREDAKKRLIQRVMNITDVVAACKESGLDWMEQLLENVSFVGFCCCFLLFFLVEKGVWRYLLVKTYEMLMNSVRFV